MPDAVAGELLSLARAFLRNGAKFDPHARLTPMSAATRALISQLRQRLAGAPGIVVVTGFPVRESLELVEAAYWLLGQQIGRPVSQTRHGDLLVRVEDRGAEIASPTQRGHRSASALAFHADRTDVVGLLCIRPAAEGGRSSVVSCRALHNSILAERPELLPVLYGRLPHDRRGEQPPGQPGWCVLPVFSLVGGDFAARYVRRFIEDSQRHEDAPRLTPGQRQAMDVVDEILHRPGVAWEMELRPGELQLINNFEVLHARSAFRDPDPPGAGRLLLRLWLTFPDSPALPPDYASLYGETAAGAYRGGVWPDLARRCTSETG